MRYCPNCCAYLHENDLDVCPKCGYDLRKAREERSAVMKEEEAGKVIDTLFNGPPCPICGEGTAEVEVEVEHIAEGERIPIKGLRLMGGEINKRARTQLLFWIRGTVCRTEHRSVLEYSCRETAQCPMCFSKLTPYGSSILSCVKCDRHYPTASFVSIDQEEALRMEGWFLTGKDR